MNYGLFFGLLLVHLLADLVFQSDNMTKQRYSGELDKMFMSNVQHALIHAIASLIVFAYYYWSWWVFAVIFLIFSYHFCIDMIKSWILIRYYPSLKYSTLIFISDQIIHIAILFMLSAQVSHNIQITPMMISAKAWLEWQIAACAASITYNRKLILFFILWVIGLPGAGIFIRIFIQGVKYKPYKKAINKKIIVLNESDENGIQDGGFIIGILERVVIIFAVATDMTNIIGFLIAAKSIARFKKFDDDSFVEYFIIGSFLSIFIAVIVGLAIRQLDILPH